MAGSSVSMDSFVSEVSWVFWVSCAVVGSWFALKFLLPGTKRAHLPPSPGVMPIVGSFPFMGVTAKEPSHKMFSRLAEKLGPIIYLRLGANHAIVVSNDDIAKQVLRDQDHIFCSRPTLSAGKYLGMSYRALAFAQSGEYQKRVRKIYSQALFAPKRLNGLQATRENGVHFALAALYQRHKEGAEVIDLTSELNDLSINSLLSMLFRRKDATYKGDIKIGTVKVSDLRALIREVMALAGEFNAGDFITIARWFDLQGVIGRMKKKNKTMTAYAAALIEEYERDGKRSPDDPDANIFDVLLSLEGEDKLNSLDLSGITYDLVIGGSDTTGHSTDWTVAELLRQPELLHRLQAELDSVVGKHRFVSEADLPSLPFLQAVVKESLRLHPPAPLGLPHCSLADTKLAGYDIPAGTTTLINLFAINRDPKHWPEPLRFNPDRFFKQKNDITMFGTSYYLLPFSSGRRGCPGMIMGVTMVQFMVANFIHSFEFQSAGGLSNESIDVITETPSLISERAQHLLVTVTPRLNSAVYEKFIHE